MFTTTIILALTYIVPTKMIATLVAKKSKPKSAVRKSLKWLSLDYRVWVILASLAATADTERETYGEKIFISVNLINFYVFL